MTALAAFVGSGRGWHIEPGHVLDSLRALPEGCVQACITSPPYWGLRSYGTDPQVWGGSMAMDCDHEISATGNIDHGHQKAAQRTRSLFCVRCGAWRGELGSEPMPDLFVAHLVEVFAEVRRVLRDDGVCFVNLGDSYAGSGKGPTGHNGIGDQENRQGFSTSKGARIGSVNGESGHTSGVAPPPGLKPKDLCLIPERFALAMQADGWWVRSRIAWCKTAPMPESITDRPTSAWEHIWLFSKSRRYFWNQDAVREPYTESSIERIEHPWNGTVNRGTPDGMGEQHFSRWMGSEQAIGAAARGRNAWNYWLLSPEPLKGMEHYAAFPTEIPRRCILAGSREGDLILDPFAGTSTTGVVALRLNRRYLGLELNPAYVTLSERRIVGDCPLFNGVTS